MLLVVVLTIVETVFSQAETGDKVQKLLHQSWQGFPDNEGEIVIDIYNDNNNDVKHGNTEENIIVLPFFSDEEFSLRKIQFLDNLVPEQFHVYYHIITKFYQYKTRALWYCE